MLDDICPRISIYYDSERSTDDKASLIFLRILLINVLSRRSVLFSSLHSDADAKAEESERSKPTKAKAEGSERSKLTVFKWTLWRLASMIGGARGPEIKLLVCRFLFSLMFI